MHLAMMRMVRPGIRECEVSAVVESIAYARNYRLSFPTIATIHGETLHNHDHSHEIKSGDLFLLDAGAETEMGYAGDMSTTVPADATFTTRQREMHELQQLCQSAAVQALRPGIRFEEIYDLSARVLVEGLIGIGLMKGDAVSAVQEGAHALFYPHGLGHMMGLDVHDMENLGERYVGYEPDRSRSTQFGRRSLRLARELEVGFVLTIEPGIYFIPELIDLWSSEGRHASFINYEKVLTYRDFGGIRNEEDYVITESGYRLLGKKIPKASLNIERRRI
jgi:Xaa-Pro aminopeptidase